MSSDQIPYWLNTIEGCTSCNRRTSIEVWQKVLNIAQFHCWHRWSIGKIPGDNGTTDFIISCCRVFAMNLSEVHAGHVTPSHPRTIRRHWLLWMVPDMSRFVIIQYIGPDSQPLQLLLFMGMSKSLETSNFPVDARCLFYGNHWVGISYSIPCLFQMMEAPGSTWWPVQFT